MSSSQPACLTFFLIAVYLNVYVCQAANCNNCCSNTTYKEINEPRRSIKSVWQQGQLPLCDRGLQSGWYRFTSDAGGKVMMPEKKAPQEYHCGTHDPIWLNGGHPSVTDGNVVRPVCINSFGVECDDTFDINVKNCGNYYVYYLKPPSYCAVAYCAGDMIPCPYGKEGVHPNCFDLPADFSSNYLGDPSITYLDDGEVEVSLVCKASILNGIEKWLNVTYRIEWFAEGQSLKSEVVCGGLRPGQQQHQAPCQSVANGKVHSTLEPTKYKIGQWIVCNVSAMFTTSPKNVWSPTKNIRVPFFAGLKFYPTVVTVESCQLSTETITITPTIPVVRTRRGLPKIVFQMPPDVALADSEASCDMELKEGTQSVTFQIKAVCNQGGVTEGLQPIVPKLSHKNSNFWSPKTHLPTIWVSVLRKAELKKCLSSGDPHYDVFHAPGRWYHFMGRGDFVMYRNTERNFEVQTRQWSCPWSPTCNCGAVLRDHNDVIEFNCCDGHLTRPNSATPMRVKIRSKKCLSPGISIKKKIRGDSIDFEVLFPSGARVTIFRRGHGLDITLDAPRAKDIAKEEGLCLYDWQENGDTYGNNLKLGYGQSYFDILPPDLGDKIVKYASVCLCTKTDQGIHNKDCQNAFTAAFPTVMKKNLTPMKLCDRQKRDAHFTDDPTEEDFQIFKETSQQLEPRFRRAVQAGHMSKENATRYCEERISKTEIGKLCIKIGMNVKGLVDSCAADIEFTGDLSFASGSVAILMNECGNLAAVNMSSSVNGSGEKDPISVDEISELLCPSDCTFNGKCVNGSCVCNKDYTAEDCSMSIYQIPAISRLQGNGLCDRRKRPCRKVTVLGTGFLNSTNMTCHVREFKVIDSSWKPNNTEHEFLGMMSDLVLTDCYLPESPVTQGYFDESNAGTSAAGLIISVSNDGEHKSKNNLTFISYDSACMSCNVSTGCHLKNNSCLINGYCFAPNETNPIDWCHQCLPQISTKAWSKRQVNLPPGFSSTTQYYAVLKETLELTIDVVDPEGMPVTLSLMDGSPSKAVARDNVLIWNATNDANTQFFLKATDACRATSYLNITVSLVACQCQNNASCVPHPNKPRGSGFYECQCVPGYTGDKCETNIDECQSYPCARGRCVDGINNYTCICDPGYVGRKCDLDFDDCSSSPCNHGNCTDYTGAYSCTCDPGYSAQNCSVDIDECESSPCINGTCVDQVNNYRCECQAGFTGYNCDLEIDECQSSPCIQGTCVDKINQFSCICHAGFTGVRCEVNINDCLPSVCVNGTCLDLVNNYTCQCHVGFTGRNCDIVIRNCSDDSCYPNVTCYKRRETISCGPCPYGLTGDGKNCKDIDYCINVTCKNGGSCVDGLEKYTCSCGAGFSGDHCETDIDDCANRTCANGGSCVDGINHYSCDCPVGYTGNHCETDINDCLNNACRNGGSCVDGVNNYSCVCAMGFTGNHCDMRESSSLHSTQTTTLHTSARLEITTSPKETAPMSTTGKGTVISSQASGNVVVSMIATSSVHMIFPTSDKITSPSPTSKGPETEEPKTDEPKTEEPKTEEPKTDEPKTEEPTTEEPETELTIELRIQKEWDDDLEDKNSEAYRDLSFLLEKEIRKQYSQDDDFIAVKILKFKKGSVVAEFKLTFKRKLENEEALAPLKEGIKDRELGSLIVDPKSLKIQNNTKEPKEEEEKEKTYIVIIGASLGGAFILALVIVCGKRYCQQQHRMNRLHALDAMPSEVTFSKAERYEMVNPRPKEDIVCYEEIGICNAATTYEELGISKDSVCFEKLGSSNDAHEYQEMSISNNTTADHYQKMNTFSGPVLYDEIGASKKAEQN